MADLGVIGFFHAQFLGSPVAVAAANAPTGYLESALVLVLGNSLRWDASLNASPSTEFSTSGTLHPVSASSVFNPLDYLYRDRQLMYADMITASAVNRVSAELSDIWNADTPKITTEGPAETTMPDLLLSQLQAKTAGAVEHVSYSSTPSDALRVDKELYTRDMLLYETLARVCEAVLSDPPITHLDSTGTDIPSTTSWSLAEGYDYRSDVNSAGLLDRDLFKKPDQRLASRDNIIAPYVATLAQILQNPFTYAHRLYVRIDGVDTREPDVFVLSSETATQRIWTSDPALSNRNRIVYDSAAKTLTWAGESGTAVHVPQIVALAVPGLVEGQTVTTVAAIPEIKDAQYWRLRANRVVPRGTQLTDISVLRATNSSVSSGGYAQVDSASLTVPGQLTITTSGSAVAGPMRVSILATPDAVVQLAGAANSDGQTGAENGITFDIDVASGSIGTKQYMVVEGDGIVYNGTAYYSGDIFSGLDGITTYSQIGVTSKVRQYSAAWNLALPPGEWKLSIDYTNLQYQADTFGIKADYSNGGSVVEILSDASPQPFTGTNGDLVRSTEGAFQVTDSNEFKVPVYWTYGTGQLHIRSLYFENTDITNCRIAVSGTYANGTAAVDVVGKSGQPEILMFDVTPPVGAGPTVPLIMNMYGTISVDPILPLKVKQVTVQSVGTYTQTEDSTAFQNWRQECVERAERAIQDSWHVIVHDYDRAIPTVYQAGSSWSSDNTEDWMSLLETAHPRLREQENVVSEAIIVDRQYTVTAGSVVYNGGTYSTGQSFYGAEDVYTFTGNGTIRQEGAFVKAHPGHLGRPCLVPNGIEFDGQTVTFEGYGTTALPVIVSCQPWMIDTGFYAAQPEFWMPEQI